MLAFLEWYVWLTPAFAPAFVFLRCNHHFKFIRVDITGHHTPPHPCGSGEAESRAAATRILLGGPWLTAHVAHVAIGDILAARRDASAAC